jgi:hypothetical protein
VPSLVAWWPERKTSGAGICDLTISLLAYVGREGHSESETYILDGHVRETYITKTVDVMTVIEFRETLLNVDRSSDSNMKTFEPV